jgi:hypothetical protein
VYLSHTCYHKDVQLRNFALSIAALTLGFSLTWAAAAPKKKAATATSKTKAARPAAKKTATKTTARRYTAPAARGRATTTYARGRARGRSPQPVPARRYYGQQAPTTDRYMEIQQALVTRGYLTTPPSGAWDPATVDALKRFQGEQNLPPTGKITSLSLIALGLGPKRTPLSTTTTLNQPVP